jgi:hypothetical protein
LFIKTLAFLFGEENEVHDVDSIKYENNFRMLMEQKIYTELFKNSEFKKILNAELNELGDLIEDLYKTKKIQQLFNRIEYFDSEDDKSIKQIIIVLLILFERRSYYQLYEVYIENQIAKLVDFHFKQIKSKRAFSDWLKENIFNINNIISDYNKLILFGKLWASKNQNDLWKIDEKYIFDSVIKLFEKYVNDSKSYMPAFNDYTIYGLYHSIKNIGELNTRIKDIFLKYWTPMKNEILCVHMIEMDTFTKSLFKISDMAIELYGSYSNFIEHIKKTSIVPSEGLKEIILFLELREIIEHNGYTVFEFEKSNPMKEKVKSILNSNSRSNYDGLDNMSQLFFVTNSQTLSSNLFNDIDIKTYGIRTSIYKEEYFIILTPNKKIDKKEVVKICRKIYDIAIDKDFWDPNTFNEQNIFDYKNFVPQKNDYRYIKLFSIQPPPNSVEPNYEIY